MATTPGRELTVYHSLLPSDDTRTPMTSGTMTYLGGCESPIQYTDASSGALRHDYQYLRKKLCCSGTASGSL